MTTAIARALSSALLHFVWQGLVVGLVLWVALFVLRKRSANIRYLVSCAALAVLLVMPIVTACLVYRAPAGAEAVEPAVPHSAPAAPPTTSTPSSGRWLAQWQSWIVPVWSAGVLLFSIRLIWGCRQVSTLRRHGTPADDSILAMVSRLEARLDLVRRVRVLITSAADGPSVVGWLRPVILLPSATLLGLTTEQLEAVLAHELAHVRRHDYLVNLAQVLVESLLFYHPAVWWISARIRQERELCCDDLAVGSCGDALCYARALTRLEKLRVTPSLAMAGNGGPLLYRIQRLVGARTNEYGPSKLSGILALTLGIACFAVNVHWARGQSHEEKKAGYAFLTVNRTEADGAGVSVNLNGADVLHRSSIEYPHTAMEQNVQGSVTVEATLEADGSVADARVLNGPSELRRAVLQSVLEWHFAPAPAGSSRQVTVNFDLAGARQPQREEPTQARARDHVQLERRARELEDKLLHERPNGVPGQSLKAQLEEVRAHLEAYRNVWAESSTSPAQVVGRRLAQIDAVGLSDEVRRSAMARLPVKIGETLSEASIERLTEVMSSFDQHHEFQPTWKLVPLGSGECALRIFAPHSEEVRTFTFQK